VAMAIGAATSHFPILLTFTFKGGPPQKRRGLWNKRVRAGKGKGGRPLVWCVCPTALLACWSGSIDERGNGWLLLGSMSSQRGPL
jgi:hypothetical protein